MAGENAGGTILTWNVANWITVILMASIGFAGLAALQSWYKNRQQSAAS